MNKLKLSAVLLGAAMMFGCGPAVDTDRELLKVEYQEYAIVSIDPPKHFWVDIKDLKSGTIFHRTGRSKHCNNYRKWRLGDKIVVRTKYYKSKSTGEVTYGPVSSDVNDILCSQ